MMDCLYAKCKFQIAFTDFCLPFLFCFMLCYGGFFVRAFTIYTLSRFLGLCFADIHLFGHFTDQMELS